MKTQVLNVVRKTSSSTSEGSTNNQNSGKAGSGPRFVEVLVPLYSYPSNAYSNELFNKVISICKSYPKVSFNIILNNSNGAGEQKDGNFTAVIKRLKACGNVRILGYTTTQYAVAPIEQVKDTVDKWSSWYGVDGIFYDEMAEQPTETFLKYYKDLRDYARKKGMYPVVTNPGFPVVEDFFSQEVADIICVFESPVSPDESSLKGDYQGGFSDYPPQTRGALLYGQSTLNTGDIDKLLKYANNVYITDGLLPNPWINIPSYFEEFVKYISTHY